MDLGLKGKNHRHRRQPRHWRSIALAFADEGANVAIRARSVDVAGRARDERSPRGVISSRAPGRRRRRAALAVFP